MTDHIVLELISEYIECIASKIRFCVYVLKDEDRALFLKKMHTPDALCGMRRSFQAWKHIRKKVRRITHSWVRRIFHPDEKFLIPPHELQ